MGPPVVKQKHVVWHRQVLSGTNLVAFTGGCFFHPKVEF